MAHQIVEEPKLDLWKHRRRMVYVSMFGEFLLLIVSVRFDINDAQADVLSTIGFAFGSVIVGYMGFAVWDDQNKRRTRSRDSQRPGTEPAIEGN